MGLHDDTKGLLSKKLCSEIVRAALRANKKVLVDPPVSNDYAKYAGASILTPNRVEASSAVGFDINSIDDAGRAAEILAKRFKLEAVVITLDKEGMYLKAAKIREHIPTIPRSVYDVAGAGDMVLSMLAVSLAGGCDYKTAVQLANIAGGIEVEKFGVASVMCEID